MIMRTVLLLTIVALAACDTTSTLDAGPRPDARQVDIDASAADADTPAPDAAANDSGADDAGVMDAEPLDAMPGDTGTSSDAGAWDGGGQDAGAADAGGIRPCVNDLEGCGCTPSATSPRGSCTYPDNRCVTWDNASGFSTCVAMCETSADCSFSDVGPHCGDVGLSHKVCTTQPAERDDVCRGNLTEQTPMAGCQDGLQCFLKSVPMQAAFEGLCGEPCSPGSGGPQGGCAAPFGYCNPTAVTHTATSGSVLTSGVCSVRRNREGNYCQAVLSNRCDTHVSGGVFACLLQGAVGPPGHGVCVETCRLDLPQPQCRSFDPVLGLATCVQFDPANAISGVCTQPCSNHPDNCTGAGNTGLGRTCVDSLALAPQLPLSFCWDITAPLLAETIGSFNGGNLQILQPGDPCAGVPSGVSRCPDNTTCIQNACVRGCSTAQDPRRPRGGCETSTSTASSCYPLTTSTTPNAGVCLEP
jgi:hypothetical protein